MADQIDWAGALAGAVNQYNAHRGVGRTDFTGDEFDLNATPEETVIVLQEFDAGDFYDKKGYWPESHRM